MEDDSYQFNSFSQVLGNMRQPQEERLPGVQQLLTEHTPANGVGWRPMPHQVQPPVPFHDYVQDRTSPYYSTPMASSSVRGQRSSPTPANRAGPSQYLRQDDGFEDGFDPVTGLVYLPDHDVHGDFTMRHGEEYADADADGESDPGHRDDEDDDEEDDEEAMQGAFPNTDDDDEEENEDEDFSRILGFGITNPNLEIFNADLCEGGLQLKLWSLVSSQSGGIIEPLSACSCTYGNQNLLILL